MKNNNQLLEEISMKLDKLILAISSQNKDEIRQVNVLTKRGLTQSEISDILGVTIDRVKDIRIGRYGKLRSKQRVKETVEKGMENE